MARGEELTFIQKRFLVQRLACHDTPTEAGRLFKEEFGFEVARNRVAYYDPTTKAGAALDPALKTIFDETRVEFLKDLDSIPIANRAVRLRHLQKQVDFFSGKNAAGIVMALCEAAAKEMGGSFTNEHKHKLSGPNGEPLPAAGPTVLILPDNGRGDFGRPSTATAPDAPSGGSGGDDNDRPAAGAANSDTGVGG